MQPEIWMWPGRRRRFKRGMMKYVVLKMLEQNERHGYDLIRHFAERGWGRLGAGTLYPVLAALEQAGYIEGRDEDGKRTYRITERGKKRLQDVADDLHSELEDDDDDDAARPAQAREVHEAMRRLSGAVKQAVHSGKHELVEQVVQRIDTARKEIYAILANE